MPAFDIIAQANRQLLPPLSHFSWSRSAKHFNGFNLLDCRPLCEIAAFAAKTAASGRIVIANSPRKEQPVSCLVTLRRDFRHAWNFNLKAAVSGSCRKSVKVALARGFSSSLDYS